MSVSVTVADEASAYSAGDLAGIQAACAAAYAMWTPFLAPSAGRLDILVTITTDTLRADGGSTMTQFERWDGGFNIYTQGAAYERNTGNDPNGGDFDIRIRLNPEFQRQYYWIDPRDGAPKPAGQTSLVDVFAHEIGHALAFNGWTDNAAYTLPGGYESTFDSLIAVIDGVPHFMGVNAQRVYGGPVPLTAGNVTHVGNDAPLPGSDLLSDLMNGVVFAFGRYAISALDIAILSDCGVATVLDDHVHGGAARDVMFGGAGNDTLDGGYDNDTLTGGTGNDVYIVTDAGDQVIERADEGSDTVFSSVSWKAAANVEAVVLMGTGNLSAWGNALANTLTGNDGSNTLAGGDGADTLYGLDGHDKLDGNSGDDLLAGNAGNDSLNGGDGADVLDGEAGDDVLNGGAGGDILVGRDGNDILDGATGDDRMFGGAGNDTYVVDMNGDGVYEATGEGRDTVKSFIDYVLPDAVEALYLMGTAAISGTGNALGNQITGNAGGNWLTGAGGDDTLTGGGGADTFVFSVATGNGRDGITDFQHGLDHLVFSAADYGFAAGHVLTTAEFTVGKVSLGASAQFLWNGHSLFWDADGNGANASIELALFSNGATVTLDDLIFI